jgi:hypothetical protein
MKQALHVFMPLCSCGAVHPLPACLPAQCLPLCQVQSSNSATIKMFWKTFSSNSPPKKLFLFLKIELK